MCNVTIYLKSGNKMHIECEKVEFRWSNSANEYIGYEIVGASKAVGIDPSQIEAWESSKK